MDCTKCGRTPTPSERLCAECGCDVGFPNVRLASAVFEKDALAKRVKQAWECARVSGLEDKLVEFSSLAKESSAVMVRLLTDLERVVKSERQLFITFHNQILAGQRLPEQNVWDSGRDAAESTVNPHYYREIQYAALSLNHMGAAAYGGYHITLKEQLIEHRATVFEENPFNFCKRHQVFSGQSPPPGFRSTWQTRNHVAIAKLHAKISEQTLDGDYPTILLSDATNTGDVECIEVHIYGPLHRSAIAHVIGKRPKTTADTLIWESIKQELDNLGATFEER